MPKIEGLELTLSLNLVLSLVNINEAVVDETCGRFLNTIDGLRNGLKALKLLLSSSVAGKRD